MRRALRIVTHNWPLKVAAILLATLLYAGLVLSQNAQIWRGHVPIIALRQPVDAYLLTTLPDVTNVRYFAPTDVAGRLNPSSFTATIDLAGAVVTPEAPFVQAKVALQSADPRVQILDFEPQNAPVHHMQRRFCEMTRRVSRDWRRLARRPTRFSRRPPQVWR